jgi:hypothetical protein
MHTIIKKIYSATLLTFFISYQARGSPQVQTQSPSSDSNSINNDHVTGSFFGWSSWSLEAYKGKVCHFSCAYSISVAKIELA